MERCSMKKNIILFFLGILCCTAQNSGEDEFGIWYMYFGMNKVSERWSIHTEAQFRYFERSGNFNQLLLRTGGNYHINANAIATLGYAFIETDGTFESLITDENSKEQRIFQQFILKNKVWEVGFEHRYRLEQRFIDFGNRNETQHRARYRLQLTLPLTTTFFLNVYDEIFINLQDNLFGQNRLYFAGGIHLTDNSSLQLGYLRNQFANAVFDRWQIGFFYNPDLREVFKKK